MQPMQHTTTGGRAEFVCDTAGTTLVVHVRGEIDHHTAVAIRGGIDTLLYEKKPERLILDLSAVGFMDSSGLGLIMGRLAVMRSLGGEVTVANPSQEVHKILALAGMDRLLHIAYTEGHEPPPPLSASLAKRRSSAPLVKKKSADQRSAADRRATVRRATAVQSAIKKETET